MIRDFGSGALTLPDVNSKIKYGVPGTPRNSNNISFELCCDIFSYDDLATNQLDEVIGSGQFLTVFPTWTGIMRWFCHCRNDSKGISLMSGFQLLPRFFRGLRQERRLPGATEKTHL